MDYGVRNTALALTINACKSLLIVMMLSCQKLRICDFSLLYNEWNFQITAC